MDEVHNLSAEVGRKLLIQDLTDAIELDARTAHLHHLQVVLSRALLHAGLVGRDLILQLLHLGGLATRLSVADLILEVADDSLLLKHVLLEVGSALAARLDVQELVSVAGDFLLDRLLGQIVSVEVEAVLAVMVGLANGLQRELAGNFRKGVTFVLVSDISLAAGAKCCFMLINCKD